MKNFPQGIFQTLDWLVKQVDKLKYQISQLSGGGGTVAVDGVTVQGDGDVTPLSSKMQVEKIGYQGSDITIPTDKSFIYIYSDTGMAGGNIVFPSVVQGFHLIVANMSGYSLTVTSSNVIDFDLGAMTNFATGDLYQFMGTPDGWMIIGYKQV